MLNPKAVAKLKRSVFSGLGLFMALCLLASFAPVARAVAAPAAKAPPRKLKIESEVKTAPTPEVPEDLFATEPRDSALPTDEYATPLIVKPAATPPPLEVQPSVPVAPAPTTPHPATGSPSPLPAKDEPVAITYDADQLPTGE